VSRPQVIDDEEHERVHDRVAAIDVAKDSGMVWHPHSAPVPAWRPAQHGVDRQGADGRDRQTGPPAEAGRHPDRHARKHERLLAYLVLRPGDVRAGAPTRGSDYWRTRQCTAQYWGILHELF